MFPELLLIAQTQFLCADRLQVTQRLSERYAEQLTATATVNEHMVAEIWTSESGTWTLIYSTTDGTACLIASGTDWQPVKPAHGRAS